MNKQAEHDNIVIDASLVKMMDEIRRSVDELRLQIAQEHDASNRQLAEVIKGMVQLICIAQGGDK